MLIDRSHRRWIVVTTLLLLIACGLYVPYHVKWSLNGPRGHTWPGLVYGGVALALMLFATAIGLRRRYRSLSFGRAETWLKGHIWLGLLAYPLVFLHAGFRLGGPLTVVLVVLYTLVVVTGVHGLLVQHVVPRLMTVQVPNETIFDQIPTYLARIRAEARRLVTEVCGPLSTDPAPSGGAGKKSKDPVEGSEPWKRFFEGEVLPYIDDGKGKLGSVPNRMAMFGNVRALSGEGCHESILKVEALCEERRTLAVQQQLHGWLHGWLLVHVPAAAALMALSLVHAVTAIYY